MYTKQIGWRKQNDICMIQVGGKLWKIVGKLAYKIELWQVG